MVKLGWTLWTGWDWEGYDKTGLETVDRLGLRLVWYNWAGYCGNRLGLELVWYNWAGHYEQTGTVRSMIELGWKYKKWLFWEQDGQKTNKPALS
jgi:hypothetical protein